MSCLRGCAGVSLGNALGICEIQIKQDCGNDCNGIPVGYSRFSVHNGIVQVCSNIGGVCECTDICCIDTIVSTNDCSGGVGPTYMLTEASLAGGVLTLNSQYEHSAHASNTTTYIPPAPGGPGGPSLVDAEETVIVSISRSITNPNPCRDMVMTVNAETVATLLDITSGGNYAVRGIIRIDGIDRISFTGDFNSPILNPPTTSLGKTISASRVFILPAGGTSLFEFEVRALIYYSGYPFLRSSSRPNMTIVGFTL